MFREFTAGALALSDGDHVVFAAEQLRQVTLAMCGACLLTGLGAWGLYMVEVSS